MESNRVQRCLQLGEQEKFSRRDYLDTAEELNNCPEFLGGFKKGPKFCLSFFYVKLSVKFVSLNH